jgi:hypothetical protein
VSSDRGGENALDDVLLFGGEETQWRIFIVVTLSTPPLNKLRVSFYIYLSIYIYISLYAQNYFKVIDQRLKINFSGNIFRKSYLIQ